MASSTHFLPKHFDCFSHALWRWVRACGCVWIFALLSATLYAQQPLNELVAQETVDFVAPESQDTFELQVQAEEVMLTASLPFALPELVTDALGKGIPVHFVQDARVLSERWYWSDKQVFHVERYLRLSYQPLTRRWRLHASTEPWSERKSTGIALGVTYDTLDDALAAMQRVVHWRVGDRAQLPSNGKLTMELSMRIDASQLPRPLQIGHLSRARWTILASRISHVDVQALR